MHPLTYLTIFCTMLITAAPLQADEVDLTADNRMEWHQKEQKMVAVGNAVATRKDLKVRGDTMTAYYKKVPPADKTQITTVHAVGNVKMSSARADAFGDTMDYDLEKDSMILKGRPAKIKTDKETITAIDSITYYPSQQKAIAIGDVHADNGQDKLFADRMVSYFEKASPNSNNLEMKKVNIYGHVKIITANATVWADRGTYLPQEGLVKLFENVTLEQDGNKLHGDYAESDLNSGISRMMAGKTSGKRVTGTFIEKPKNSASKPQTSNNAKQ